MSGAASLPETLDCVVIGAGAVGLAIARHLAQQGREVIILEAEPAMGTQTSTRNSAVSHAGLYYPPGSLKARLCVAGKAMLDAFCITWQVPHRLCGKLVVATEAAQLERLQHLLHNARCCGVADIQWLEKDAVQAKEGAVRCEAALFSPRTGILDCQAYMLALLAQAEAAGAVLLCHAPVTGGLITARGVMLEVSGSSPCQLLAHRVINSAGLGAHHVAGTLGGFPKHLIPPLYLAKGNYFALHARHGFNHLVYPLPDHHSLGIHLTLDLASRVRFGPDVEWLDTSCAGQVSLDVDPGRAPAFYSAIRQYWPDLPDESLYPDYAGIRPRMHGPNQRAFDFRIDGPQHHGIPGLVHLFGIESPGLTASLAIAEHVAALLG
jgi:L-2-hydroxyglutarate oxidase LhgO